MDNLKELGTIWQKFTPSKMATKEIDFNNTDILNKLKKLEKKQLRINLAKTIGVGICMVLFCYSILSLDNISNLTKIAIGWIITSLTIGMIIYWKKQYNSSRLSFIENCNTFIESTISKLNSQKQIITILLPVMVSCMIIGINLIYFDFLKNEDFSFRITSHLSITIIFLLIMFIGIKIRKRRFNNDFKPLIDDLKTIKQKINNHE